MNNEVTVATGLSQEPQALGRPRLGHLFVITTTCAFVAGLGRFYYDPSAVEEEHTLFAAIYWAVGSLLYGVAIGAAVVLIWEGRRQIERPRLAPGHWLVLFFAVSLAVQLAAMAVCQTYVSWSADPWAEYYGACLERVISGSVECGLCFLIAAQLASETRWWAPPFVCGVALAAVTMIYAAMFVGFSGTWGWTGPLAFELFGSFLIAGLLGKAWRTDARAELGQDWLHKLGVVLGLLFAMTSLASSGYWLAAI